MKCTNEEDFVAMMNVAIFAYMKAFQNFNFIFIVQDYLLP